MARAQANVFAPEPQADLFGVEAVQPVYRPDLDRVRRRLERILNEVRSAASMPWDRSQLSLYRTVVPQLAVWLPDEEAAQWRRAFEHEVTRLEETA